MTTMTTKERLILMDDIKRKNDIAWGKYANQTGSIGQATPDERVRMLALRPAKPAAGQLLDAGRMWTWEADVKKPFRPFDGVAGFCILMVCIPVLLVLFLMMA